MGEEERGDGGRRLEQGRWGGGERREGKGVGGWSRGERGGRGERGRKEKGRGWEEGREAEKKEGEGEGGCSVLICTNVDMLATVYTTYVLLSWSIQEPW